ncbi:MAG: GNAT family N-acetyltransferase [Candidatus Eremiobacteraeota bacterium]|nr:GNAT family N-acetyltransferase [Candidatus Eremiobacteraeota bacterium]
MLEAELRDPALLGTILEAKIPGDWPPGDYDRGAIEFLLRETTNGGPEKQGWLSWYAIRTAVGDDPATLVGAGGYFGPPDARGQVEIGFSISKAWQRQGFATELVRALLWRAAESGRVRFVRAHTLPGNAASIAVLRSSGFEPAVPGEHDLLCFEYEIQAARDL